MQVLNSIIETYGTETIFGVDPGTADVLRANIGEFNHNNNENKEYHLESVGPVGDHQYIIHLGVRASNPEGQPQYVTDASVTYGATDTDTDDVPAVEGDSN